MDRESGVTQNIALMIESPRVSVRLRFCVVVAGVLSICGGCKLVSDLNPLPQEEPKMTAQELLQSLRSFVTRTVRVAETTAADRILANSSERREQFLMLNCKKTPSARSAWQSSRDALPRDDISSY